MSFKIFLAGRVTVRMAGGQQDGIHSKAFRTFTRRNKHTISRQTVNINSTCNQPEK